MKAAIAIREGHESSPTSPTPIATPTAITMTDIAPTIASRILDGLATVDTAIVIRGKWW